MQTRLATLLREQGEPLAARAHCQAAVARRPGYVPAHLGLGLALAALGDIDGARSAWEAARTLEPENAQAKMYLRTLGNAG